MTSFASIADIVDKNAHRRPDKKPLPPMRTHGGDILHEEDTYRLPNTGRPAVIEDGKADDPWRGRKCSVRRCKAGVQFKVQERLDDDFGIVEPDPFVPSDNPLTVQLEAAVHAVRPAVLVPLSEPVFLCLKHWHEFMDARNAKVVQEREACQPASWHLSELNYEGATIEVHDSSWFTITDGDGKSMKLEIWHLDEVKARMEGREYRQQVLTPEQRRLFVLNVKFPNAADIPESAKMTTTYNTIKG